MSVVFAGTKRKLENSHAPARTDRPYRAQIRALAPVFRSPQAILRRARKTGPESKSLPSTIGTNKSRHSLLRNLRIAVAQTPSQTLPDTLFTTITIKAICSGKALRATERTTAKRTSQGSGYRRTIMTVKENRTILSRATIRAIAITALVAVAAVFSTQNAGVAFGSCPYTPSPGDQADLWLDMNGEDTYFTDAEWPGFGSQNLQPQRSLPRRSQHTDVQRLGSHYEHNLVKDHLHDSTIVHRHQKY